MPDTPFDSPEHAAEALGGTWSVDLWLWRLNWSPQARALHEARPGFTPALWDLVNYFDLADRPPLIARFFECINTGRAFELEVGLTTFCGRHRRVRLTAFAQPGADGRVEMVRGVIAPLPPAARADDAAAAPADLLAATRELEALAYAIPHELRAPLAAVHGFAKVLQETEAQFLSARGRHYLDRILASTLRMDRLTQALLALAPLSSVALEREAVDLSAAAHQVVETLRAADPARQVTVHIEPELCAEGDPALLAQVLGNLIGNAWKFTAGREQALIAVQRVAAGDAHRATYVVHDNGAGFDMQHAARLFTPFARLHPRESFEGCGVGLAIARRIVERHGGRIWAEAVPQQGASFYFTLTASDACCANDGQWGDAQSRRAGS